MVEVVRETNQFWRLTQMTALNTEQLTAFALLFSANPDIRTIELGLFKSEVLDSLCFETGESRCISGHYADSELFGKIDIKTALPS